MQDLSLGLRQNRLRFSAASLPGLGAALNQDSYACRSPDFFGVADGVGGGALGEVASAILVRQLGQLQAPQAEAVNQALKDADLAIAQRLTQEGQGPGAAVCAAVWLTDAKTSTWLAMNVGDCKILVANWNGSAWRIRWASTNQSYAHCGITPPPGVSVDAPANMVGCGLPLSAQFYPITLAAGERLILCSDGFYNALNVEDIQKILNETPQPLSLSSAQTWCERAQRNGALDDVTVILVEPVAVPAVISMWWWTVAFVLAMALAFGSWDW
ncbi:protein phosphatase 2C domain-containing protein [Limnohabitans sp.]|uniref:PP2C family protein-serine/threonine phosphatase n=1 Tax=Limnohabitans sp. TaxID=1907725 RepID=UPI0025C65AAE|nr:protein phosphatase 2C domain-containing protein [Limnohabitans sp.]